MNHPVYPANDGHHGCCDVSWPSPVDRTPSMSTFDSIEMGRGWDEDSIKDADDRVPGVLLW